MELARGKRTVIRAQIPRDRPTVTGEEPFTGFEYMYNKDGKGTSEDVLVTNHGEKSFRLAREGQGQNPRSLHQADIA
eukprot:scaffold268_cov210-Ochromonas_danica.AAC.35